MGLEKLLYLRGVGAEFTDCFGQYIRISETDRQGILTCMLLDNASTDGDPQFASAAQALLSDESIAQQIYELDALPWTQVLPEFQWCFVDEPWISLYLPYSYKTDINITIHCEDGESILLNVPFSTLKVIGDYRIPEAQGERQYIQYRLDLIEYGVKNNTLYTQTNMADEGLNHFPVLGLGYHTITFVLPPTALVSHDLLEAQVFHGTLMVAPRTAYQGVLSTAIQGKRHKPWGVSIQLYSLRSETQWGIGDFGDLEALITLVATQGADFIQLNPLHALDIAAPEHSSPYSPCDRRRLNPLYIHMQSVPEYELLATEFASSSWQEAIHVLHQDNWLNYPKITDLKYRAFARLYCLFCEKHLTLQTPRAKHFHDFVAEQGAALLEFAEAECLRSPRAIVQDAGFYLYLQFVAQSQLALCQLKAKEAGMGIGLIRDLAVGAALHGVEVQANVAQFCLNVSIGAPPDPFAPQGQNWGLTPLDPIKLKQDNFRHFIALMRANMEHCGALRIDHVMGLLRLWWWPLDKNLGKGAYVYYPVETLLAIVCLESQRARCVVIGEDLGLVPPDIIHRLYNAGIYGNELFYFCRDHQGFKAPSQYKPQSLMMLANHDVPTLVAWWSGSDLHLRRQLSLFETDDQLASALAERAHEKQQLLSLLVHQGLLGETSVQEIDIPSLLTAWMTLGASGNSALYSVQWCDLLADSYAVNIPGTWLEYPNWQRHLPQGIEQAAKMPELLQRLQHIAAARQLPH
ncbi:4-alpha-glucanotransferase [Shewanella putrefaciens]|uniref:4-alpha-glucanotransferase n=1 Tax=Shewanella putrefaciens TaxID=24 RepID=A0ABX8XEU2_SHEPU|nr:4-alpha-glucanotransferase [Shewanella putrefaciens]QSE50533.1 4-alpha-glucanotransferase [Shewanella putrefaciens]QYX73943.1 4-alpha-glucanotransferase [Shewanella putrefaciens]GGN13302.1 4-alpha-glucanotransferase [Shewanella putrefaciens]